MKSDGERESVTAGLVCVCGNLVTSLASKSKGCGVLPLPVYTKV